ncbi:hypothetical protein [Egbenema bharatensis]|uniref:hypothetical protein n=1 Tax=Egbenema bharatensis TaxID=3463334 RepID=UPI003A8AF0F0
MTIAVEQATNTTLTADMEQKTGMSVGIPKEIYPGECRVAATPDTAKLLQKMGFRVLVETGAGEAANFPDDAYREAGCALISDTSTLWESADIILKVRSPEFHTTLGKHEAELLHDGQTLISFIYPAQNPELLQKLAAQKATVLAMDSVPRISRAKKWMPSVPWPTLLAIGQ